MAVKNSAQLHTIEETIVVPVGASSKWERERERERESRDTQILFFLHIFWSRIQNYKLKNDKISNLIEVDKWV